jgi:hypothetical protein
MYAIEVVYAFSHFITQNVKSMCTEGLTKLIILTTSSRTFLIETGIYFIESTWQ